MPIPPSPHERKGGEKKETRLSVHILRHLSQEKEYVLQRDLEGNLPGFC